MILRDKHIFMVEDNIANRAIEQTLLEQEGAEISFDRWGTETIEKLRNAMPVDIILLDLMFPNNVTGYDIFTEIRTYTEFDHIPIVAISASDPSSAIPKTRSFGFAGYISKPVSFNQFAQQIADLTVGQPIWQHR
jgi:CheY-like chemotaxis protein